MAQRRLRLIWVLIAISVVIATIVVYRARERSTVPVRTTQVERQDIHTGVITNGRSEPIEFREVHAEVEGEVLRVLVHEGDAVRQGQKLVELSQRQIVSELEGARAELTDAENTLRLLRQGGTELERRELRAQVEAAQRERDQAAKAVADNERLVEKGAVARMELEESRNRLTKAEADLALLQQKMNQRYDPEELTQAAARRQAAHAALTLAESRQRSLTVVSPLGGMVYSIAVRPGDIVRNGDLLARVGDLRRIRVRVFVDEPDLGRIAAAQPVRISWDGLPGKQWQGKVERLPTEVRELGTRKVGEVSCTLDNPERAILPNMNLNVEIVTESRPAVLTLPREAVFGADHEQHVFLVREGRLARQPVQTGILNPTRIEIRQGLQEGDEVVLAGEQLLQEGARVRSNSE